jgi:glycosyltransferase involved in cell wall biosynthesis
MSHQCDAKLTGELDGKVIGADAGTGHRRADRLLRDQQNALHSSPARAVGESQRISVGSSVMTGRLLLLTPSELTRDPRARRAAIAAQRLGFEVVGLCRQLSGEAPVKLEGVSIRRVGSATTVDSLRDSGLEPARRELPLIRELRGLYRLGRLAGRTVELYLAGRAVTPRVIHANDFETLPAAWLLARRARARLVYDAHELYSEFEVDPPRGYRAATLCIEGALARRAEAVVTVSDEIAAELEWRLSLGQRPLVVLNVPELEPAADARSNAGGPLRVAYQGSFGTGRRADELLDAIVRAPNVRLTLRGLRLNPEVLRRAIHERGLDDRVEVAPPVAPGDAVRSLRGADVGVIFDRPVTLNGELSLPNKLFEYLMAGCAVVVPDLPALANIVEREGVGLTFRPGRPDLLAESLEQLAADPERLRRLRDRALEVARSRYNAETQAATLAAAWGAG